MNTITNFRMNQPINQQNKSNTRQKLYTPASQPQPAQNVQFKGLNLRSLRALTPRGRRIERGIMEHHSNVAYMFDVPASRIVDAAKDKPMRRLHFLDALAKTFHSKYGYGTNAPNPESPDVALRIFDMVKKPKKEHFRIVNELIGSMENMEEIFKLAKDDPKKLRLAINLNHSVVSRGDRKKANSNLIIDVLKSEHVDTYAKNFPKYEAFLYEHKKDENAVKKLDEMVVRGKQAPKQTNTELEIQKIFANNMALGETNVLNRHVIMENYTPEGNKFLNAFSENIGSSPESLKAGDDKEILEMYKTTTKSNLSLRKSIMESYENSRFNNLGRKDKNPQISELRILFDKVDSDKHAAGYVKKLIKYNKMPSDVKSINTLFDNVPTKKLDIFYHNARNIMSQTSGEERYVALRTQIKNPLFLTENRREQIAEMKEIGLKEGLSPLDKVVKYVGNLFNLARYSLTGKEAAKVSERTKAAEDAMLRSKMMEHLQKQGATNSVMPDAAEVKAVVVEPVEVKEVKPAKVIKDVKIARTAPKAPNAKKLAVINDVNGIIEKKLGAKTLDDQKRDYAIKATKMRMQMLPEIFASIKETRAAERAAGKKLSVSNKDALDLYSQINGRNKKLVNYMLKKRNADGTRTFGLKDIIKTVEQSEKKVRKDKLAAPKTYRAADARAYYNTLLEGHIQQYGKLQRTKQK